MLASESATTGYVLEVCLIFCQLLQRAKVNHDTKLFFSFTR